MTHWLKRWRKHGLLAMIGALLLVPVSFAYAVTIKENAPKTYTVQQNDTLWDIASLFLDKPWLWPDLWRKNTQIANPHLIYPGDVLTIRMVDGLPVMQVAREKKHLTLSPTMIKQAKPVPIGILPWAAIAPYINKNELIEEDEYEKLPYILGNPTGSMRFVSDDLVLSRSYGRSNDQYRVVRKQATIKDLEGEVLGVQIHHVADASMVEDDVPQQWLIKVDQSNFEARRGDRLFSGEFTNAQNLKIQAARDQRGHVVDNLHQHELLGRHDVVIVDLGAADVDPGMVMGIYAQGPDIIDGETPRYANESNAVYSIFDDGSTVVQPAIKIGELIIFKTYDKASYGIITRARELVKIGAIVANP
ncbi:LysM peptidoglycan-binding domain-containing protein [Alteromonas pelagimontana]|uniref:LysM peptidoglycan-binding domain-containing protein n=1 Tax=Alteromonas pelagimontana TaxID=1858656 RepID=A0A6M4MDT7_9ALTE|nr:LysM peptidoglycan-binding domain-containing protein [Alteromonas pelagimontana]QJR80998.1 LysM peptidoglycan-binding domain-containing protein [Alteromonas pelagimontana]